MRVFYKKHFSKTFFQQNTLCISINSIKLSNKPKCDFINFQYNLLEKYFFLDFFAKF